MAGISSAAKLKLESYDYPAFKSWDIRLKVIGNDKLVGKSELMRVNMMLERIYVNKGLMVTIMRYGHRMLTVGSMIRDSAQEHDLMMFFRLWGRLFSGSKISYRSSILRLVVTKKISIPEIVKVVRGNIGGIRSFLERSKGIVVYNVGLLKKDDGSFRPLQVPHPAIWLYSRMVYVYEMRKYVSLMSGRLSTGGIFIDYACSTGFSISGLIDNIGLSSISTDVKKAYDNINLGLAIIEWGKLSSGDNKHLQSYGKYLYSVWPCLALVQGSQVSAALCVCYIRSLFQRIGIGPDITVLSWIDNLIVTGNNSSKVISELGSLVRLKEILPIVSSRYNNVRILGIWIAVEDNGMVAMTSTRMWNEWLGKDRRNSRWSLGGISKYKSWQVGSSGKGSANEELYYLISRSLIS